MTSPSASLPAFLLRNESRWCRSCDRQVESKPRFRLAGLGIGATTALVLVMVGFSALIGPFIMFTAPLILVAGFALGPLARLATEPPSCPHCHRELIFLSRPETSRRIARVHAAAPEGVMKAA
jgi:hypothetical protein